MKHWKCSNIRKTSPIQDPRSSLCDGAEQWFWAVGAQDKVSEGRKCVWNGERTTNLMPFSSPSCLCSALLSGMPAPCSWRVSTKWEALLSPLPSCWILSFPSPESSMFLLAGTDFAGTRTQPALASVAFFSFVTRVPSHAISFSSAFTATHGRWSKRKREEVTSQVL